MTWCWFAAEDVTSHNLFIGIQFAYSVCLPTWERIRLLNTTTTFRYRVQAALANLHMCRNVFWFVVRLLRVTSATLCPHTMAPYWTSLKSNWIFSSCKHFNKSMRAFIDTLWVWPSMWMVFLQVDGFQFVPFNSYTLPNSFLLLLHSK